VSSHGSEPGCRLLYSNTPFTLFYFLALVWRYSDDLSALRTSSQRTDGRQSTSSASGRQVLTNYVRSPTSITPAATATSSGTYTYC